MTRRVSIIYGLLVLLPTLTVGVVVAHLLRSEANRLAEASRLTAIERGRAIADVLQLTVFRVQDELSEALGVVPANAADQVLLSWEDANPLVRNVFIWRKEGGTALPPPPPGCTREEASFLLRFDALLSGRRAWRTASATRPESHGYEESTSSFVKQVRQLETSNKSMLKLEPHTWGEGARPTGWIPWFMDNHLYLLGWIEAADGGGVYGVELELMALLSRLIAVFPDSKATAGATVQLRDSLGRILHQAGPGPSAKAQPAMVSLAPALPHWELALYPPERAVALSPRVLMLGGGVLLLALLGALLLGGGLLMNDARRSWNEARRKTSFVSNVSHELKTPLTSIRMYAELMAEGRVADEATSRRYLEVIGEESRRLTRLVNNMLDFARLEQGRKHYKPEAIDLPTFIEELLEVHGLRLARAGMQVELKGSAGQDLPRVSMDRDALEQALLNVVDNALKYAAEGGELLIEIAHTPRLATVTVSDRGPGIPPPHRRRIFDKFHRVDESLTSRRQGSGLGLSIARGLMRDLGGELSYTPRTDGGSHFVFSIPWETSPS